MHIPPANRKQRPNFRRFGNGIVLFALALTCTLHLPLFSDSQLSENSPFLPPGYGKQETKKPEPRVQPQGPISREIEFRGIVELDGEYQFSIFNKKEQKSYWLKENEAKESGIKINNYNADASSIVVLMNGRSERLTLMTASENPMPVAQSTAGSTAKPGVPPNLGKQIPEKSGNRRTVPRRRVILPKKK